MGRPTKVSLAPNKGGRPPKLTADAKTLATLDGLGQIQCTTKEAACVLGVAESTFLRFMAEHEEARQAFEMGKGKGRHSLRRTQFNLARSNAAMAIFLGKNYLEQADKRDDPPADMQATAAAIRKLLEAADAETDAGA